MAPFLHLVRLKFQEPIYYDAASQVELILVVKNFTGKELSSIKDFVFSESLLYSVLVPQLLATYKMS